MADGSVYEVGMYYEVEGELCANVLHFKQAGAGDAMAAAQEIRDGWMTIMKDILGTDTLYNKVTVLEKVHVGFPDAAELAVNIPGGSVVVSIPPQLAACFSIKTAQYSKSGRGRWYQGGLYVSEENGARLSTMALTTTIPPVITALTNRYIGDDATSTLRLGVFSRKNFSLLSNPLESSFNAATSISVHSVLSTMRSRKPVA